MSLNKLAKKVYAIAKSKGWHDKPVAFSDAIANIHAELSEAWEEHRNGHKPNETYYSDNSVFLYSENTIGTLKPEGIPSEFADVIIRILDSCEEYGIDIEEAIRIKMQYNKKRHYKHGGKVV